VSDTALHAAPLADRLDRLRTARVVVVGDVMIDRFVTGVVERISPEAPVPVLRVAHESTMLGGAGNVARNIAALGASVTLVGVVGDDGPGAEVGALLAAEGGIAGALAIDPSRPTSVKTRYLSGGQQLLRTDVDGTGALGATVRAQVVERAAAALDGAGALVLSDYAKGVLGPETIAELASAASAAGLPTIADPKGTDFSRYRGVRLLTPNRNELRAATGLPTGSDDEVVAAAFRVIEHCGIESVLVTRGAEGMTLVRGGAEHFPTRAREVFDVSGAGDTVVATTAAAWAAGFGLDDAVRLANVAAGIVVGKVGTAVARPAEIVAELGASEGGGVDPGIVGRAAAIERVAQWRRRGRRVVFTNGCFDILHPGHVSLLRQARAAGDVLVVGLNSDDSVRRLKGAGRPVQSEAARAAVLASLETVDIVVIFGEDTPLSLIEDLRPDVLVKGADYTEDTVVGADLVRGYGGKVVLAALAEGHSTSATIARIGKATGAA
jgi:D-beta-D-heptose 7-phosphate kinase/D-beta-D-heptose 1-phosphate adenosyltransferase